MHFLIMPISKSFKRYKFRIFMINHNFLLFWSRDYGLNDNEKYLKFKIFIHFLDDSFWYTISRFKIFFDLTNFML